MQPALHFNIYAMIVAVLANMFIGFLWFGPVFGRPWAKEMGYNIDEMKPDSKQMTKSMILMIVGTILSVFVLAHIVEVWRPSVWGQGADQAAWTYGFFGGFFTWIGFHVPMLLGQIAWINQHIFSRVWFMVLGLWIWCTPYYIWNSNVAEV